MSEEEDDLKITTLKDIVINRSNMKKKFETELGHLDDKPRSRDTGHYPDSKQITRTVIEALIRQIGWEIEEEGSSLWWRGVKKPAAPHLIYAKTGRSLRNVYGERVIVNTKQKSITSEATVYTYGKNKSNINKLKELINQEVERERLNKEQKEKEKRKLKEIEFEKQRKIANAREKEEHLDYEGALEIWVKLGNNKEAKRIRRKMMDEKKVDQTIVHGDYVDDRDTIVKDSVINRSNVGSGSSKMQELEKLTEMKEKGLIDDDDYEKMKREIIG